MPRAKKIPALRPGFFMHESHGVLGSGLVGSPVIDHFGVIVAPIEAGGGKI
jgi:hypothetical protein